MTLVIPGRITAPGAAFARRGGQADWHLVPDCKVPFPRGTIARCGETSFGFYQDGIATGMPICEKCLHPAFVIRPEGS